MKDKLNELRKKAKEKSFYQFTNEERVKYFNKKVFEYDDSNIPYKYRKEIYEKMRRDSN